MQYPTVNTPQQQLMGPNERLADSSPWELHLEEGEAIMFEGTFKVDQLIKFTIVVCSLILCFPLFWVFIPVFVIAYCFCIKSVLRRMFTSQRCIVTTRALYYYAAKPQCCCCCWGQEQRMIPHDKIQDINISQGWLEAKFGIFTVKIETAGQAGPQAQSEGVIRGLQDPVAFRQALFRARGAVAPAPTRSTLPQPSMCPPVESQAVVARLDRLEGVLERIEANTRK